MRFSGKTTLIAGGISEMSSAVARRFAAEGAKLVVAGLDEERGTTLANQTGGTYLKIDTANVDEFRTLASLVKKQFRQVDVIVNVWCEMMADDAKARARGGQTNSGSPSIVTEICRTAVPLVKDNPGGSIINVAPPIGSHEIASVSKDATLKESISNCSRDLTREFSSANVRINAVLPGLLETTDTAVVNAVPDLQSYYSQTIPVGRMGSVEEVAGIVAFLASDEAAYIAGATIPVDGGMAAHSSA